MTKKKRLDSTKSIFNGHVQTTFNLLIMIEREVQRNHSQLNKFHGRVLRASRSKTLEKIRSELEIYAIDAAQSIPAKSNQTYLLYKIQTYKRQNSFMLYSGIHQTIINICVIYEDFIKRIMLKYYEENIMRIPSKMESMKNSELVSAIKRGDNIHQALASAVASRQMGGGVSDWHDVLRKQQFKSLVTSDELKELFLIRNCFVHNNRKVSSQLHQSYPQKYTFKDSIRLTVQDVSLFKDEVHKSAVYIMSEYGRLQPKPLGTWL